MSKQWSKINALTGTSTCYIFHTLSSKLFFPLFENTSAEFILSPKLCCLNKTTLEQLSWYEVNIKGATKYSTFCFCLVVCVFLILSFLITVSTRLPLWQRRRCLVFHSHFLWWMNQLPLWCWDLNMAQNIYSALIGSPAPSVCTGKHLIPPVLNILPPLLSWEYCLQGFRQPKTV